MEMFNFVLDSFKGEIFGFKVKRQDLIAGTVNGCGFGLLACHEYCYLNPF